MTSSSDELRPEGIPAGRFVGEPIDPEAGSFDAAAMSRGEPGPMRRFAWRGETIEVKATIACWKSYSPCRTSHSTERYLRRHWYHVETADGRRMTLYVDRQSRERNAKRRWWLYEVVEEGV